jgi:hypothetical protein
MGDTPFFDLPTGQSLGPQLFAAPSSAGANNFVPPPATLIPVIAYATKLADASKTLRSLLDDVLPKVSRDISGALAAMRALAGVAHAMDDTLQFRPMLDPSIVGKCHTLKSKADDLLASAMNKVGADVNPRNLIPDLDGRVRDAVHDIVDLLRDPAHVADIKAYAEDTSVPVRARYPEIWFLGTLQAIAVELLARTDKHDEVQRIADEVLHQGDESGSAPAITVKEGKTLWDAFVQATLVATNTVGNLPAPDTLSVALIKCYGAYALPSAALHSPKAGSLERDLLDMLMRALKLTDAQKADLKGRLDELKAAQSDVIRAAKAEADTAARLPGHQARIARKTRQRVAAEERCQQKAEAARDFYKEAYGAKEEVYGVFQRGPFIDSFVSVLAIIQFCAAFQELDDPDVPSLQKFADVTGSGVLALGAVVSTVGRLIPQIDIGIAKFNLATLGQVAEGMAVNIAKFAGVMAIVSGGVNVYVGGWVTHDPKTVVMGGLTMLSGGLIVWGAVFASAAATGVGVGIGVLLAGYCAFDALSNAMKNDTEKGIEAILASLKDRLSFRDKTVVQLLGLDDALKAVEDALDGFDCFQLRPNPNGAPTREDLRRRMTDLGFKSDLADGMVESPDDNVPPPMFLLTQ